MQKDLWWGVTHSLLCTLRGPQTFFVLHSERAPLDGCSICAFKGIHVNMLITQSCWKVAFVRSGATHHLSDPPSALASSSRSPSGRVFSVSCSQNHWAVL